MGKSSHLCVLTRYKIKKEILQSANNCVGVELEDDNGRTLHAFSVWIESKNYAPYSLKDKPDSRAEDLIACETKRSKRFKQTQNILRSLKTNSLTELQGPLLVGGDWNSPSHLDWTEASVKNFPHRVPVNFPVSKAMQTNGFIDIYRSIHPDPVKFSSETWSPLFRDKPQDRIDRLYYKSNRNTPL